MERIKILPTVTTTFGSDWKSKIKEINRFGIEEIAVFLTGLDAEKRKEFYNLLEKSKIKNIPFVHLRSDMKIKEVDYFVKKFDTQVFNIHTEREFPFICSYSKYRKIIHIENIFYPLSEKEIRSFGGICLDFSHLENDRLLYKKKFEHNIKIIEKFSIGCNHISAVKSESYYYKTDRIKKHKRCDYHQLEKLCELDYLKNYPLKYFSSYIAIELENSLEEQLEAKKHIEKIIKFELVH